MSFVPVSHQMGLVDDDEIEPVSVGGLGNLTSGQQALVEFLEVDEDLLAGAGTRSPVLRNEGLAREEVEGWIEALPRDEVKSILNLLLESKGQLAERTIKNRFAAWRRSLRGDRTDAPRCTVGELLKNVEAAEKLRLEQEKREKKQREIKRCKEREA